MDLCTSCGEAIDPERVAIYQDLFSSKPARCARCSQVEAPVVLMNYGHKTGGQITVVPQNPDGTNNPERVRQALRCHARSR